jgi:tetratricopeptide (TPR) repeat protein
MSHSPIFKTSVCLTITLVLVLFAGAAPNVLGQTSQTSQEQYKKAAELIEQQRFTEAFPILEQLANADPDNADVHFYLGFALIAQVKTTKDTPTRKTLRLRARSEFLKAKQLGVKQPVVDALIESIPADGSEGGRFSNNAEADQLMVDGEAMFSQGKLDDALKCYQKALDLDPKLYEAAVFSGDVSLQRGDFNQAEIWYQRAISINPDRETAYRYSATPLMKQGKHEQARDRYIEAYISEPYNRFSNAGLMQWAEVTKTVLVHPKIDVPTSVGSNDKGEVKINLDASMLAGGKDDGSFAWLSYGTTRALWRNEKFAKTFPGEKAYRHSLAEEADALRSVVTIASAEKNAKSLSRSLATLKKLSDENLLEAYILLARADEGIIQDYPAYLRQHRDQLRRYVMTYVLTGGGMQ